MKYYILQSVEADTLEEAIEKIAQGGLDKDVFDVKLQTKKDLLAHFHEENGVTGILDVEHSDDLLEEIILMDKEPIYLDADEVSEEHLFTVNIDIDPDRDNPLLRKVLDDCKENDCAYFRLITR